MEGNDVHEFKTEIAFLRGWVRDSAGEASADAEEESEQQR